jgi:hypothetical protein
MPTPLRLLAPVSLAVLVLVLPANAIASGKYTKNLSHGTDDTYDVDVNEFGDMVGFVSKATNLRAPNPDGTPQVYTQNWKSGDTWLASVSPRGQPARNPAAGTVFDDPFVDDRVPDPWKQLISNVDMGGRGRSVVFSSTATNLVPGDRNGRSDVFIHGRDGKGTELVSKDTAGGPANGHSWGASYGDGEKWVAFISTATDLVPGGNDDNGQPDAFLRDLDTKQTYLVSHDRGCGGSNGPVHDVTVGSAKYVAYSSSAPDLVAGDTNRASDVFHWKRPDRPGCGETYRTSVSSSGRQANGPSWNVTHGGAGKFTAFESLATNLVPNDTNGESDIFWRIRTGQAYWGLKAPKTIRVSVSYPNHGQLNGASANARMTAAGRFVFFDTEATNANPPHASDRDARPAVYHFDVKEGKLVLTGQRNDVNTGVGAKKPEVSYHGTKAVFLSYAYQGVGRPSRDGVLDALLRYGGEESAPPPPGV